MGSIQFGVKVAKGTSGGFSASRKGRVRGENGLVYRLGSLTDDSCIVDTLTMVDSLGNTVPMRGLDTKSPEFTRFVNSSRASYSGKDILPFKVKSETGMSEWTETNSEGEEMVDTNGDTITYSYPAIRYTIVQ